MFRTLCVATAVLFSTLSSAQDKFNGLDLSSDEAPEGTTSTPDTKSTSMSDPSTPELEPPARKRAPLVELDIIREDRVKSVQRKLYLKRNRFELAPYVTFAVNDPYYSKVGVAARLAYYLSDSLALSSRLTWMQTLPTDDVRIAKREFQSIIYYSVPVWSLVGNAEWSLIYGKAAFMNTILHFDGYVLGGAGAVITETSSLPNRGPNPAADVGVGMRFVVKDFLAVNAALTNTTYVDQPKTTKSSLQNLMMLNVGISLFIPFKSTYREAE